MVEAVTPPNPAGARSNGPDPTLLTIDSIRREITMLENLFDTRLLGMEDLIAARLLRIDQLLDRSEGQRIEQKNDTNAAVDAALASQKEATAKMEKSISDQIASLRANFETEIRSVHQTSADQKEALTRLESMKAGVLEQRTEGRAMSGTVTAVVGVGVSVILVLIAIAGVLGATT